MERSANDPILARLQRADDWRHRLDRLWIALGRRREPWLFGGLRLAGDVVMDLGASARLRRLVPFPGQPHLAALDSDLRLPQDPRFRTYWFDPERHAMVGMHLGVDLVRNAGRYHVLESNFDAGMRPQRRRMYEPGIDPVFATLATTAAAHGFKRLVLLKSGWCQEELGHLERAARDAGVDVVPAVWATLPGTSGSEPSLGEPMTALPDPLPARSMHVVFCSLGKTPLIHFMHNKVAAGRWLAKALGEAGEAMGPLARVPTSERLVLFDAPSERWPNLVVKIADVDKGEGVVMGRFATEDEARRALGLGDKRGGVPRVFRRGLQQKVLHALTVGRPRVLYQPFIPSEIDGRTASIRMHVLISPLASLLLSTHAVVSAAPLPDALPFGLVEDVRPFVQSFARGAYYRRLDAEIETELQDVARAYGDLATWAIERRFETSPAG